MFLNFPFFKNDTSHNWVGSLHFLCFVLIIASLVYKYEYNEIAEKGPQSTHSWRQADSAIQALCYYESGMSFFKPCVYNLNNETGLAAAEFPIIYYTAAGLYHILGPQEWILRVLNFLIFSIGLYCFSLLILALIDNFLLSLVIPIFIFGAPVIVYYGFNFIPNVPALGFSLMSIYFYYRFINTQKHLFFGLSSLTIILAGLLKITLLVSFFALFGIYLVSRIPSIKRKLLSGFFPKNRIFLPSCFAVLLVVLGWTIWAQTYNEVNHSGLFLTNIKPIWEVVQKDLNHTWFVLVNKTANYFFSYETSLFLLFSILVILFNYQKIRWELHLFFWLVIMGSLAYLALFFEQLRVHNYYFVDIMIVPLLIISLLAGVIQSLDLEKKLRYFFYILLILLTNANLNASYYYNHNAYQFFHKDLKKFNTSFFKKDQLQHFLLENGVKKEDKIISYPDRSPNTTLYYLNRKGWTETFMSKGFTDRLPSLKKRGALWLVINNRQEKGAQKMMAMFDSPVAIFDDSIYLYDMNKLKSPH